MADELNQEDQEARNNVRYLNEQLLKSQNLYEIKQKQLRLEKDINFNAKMSAQMSAKEQENAKKYIESFQKLEKLQKQHYQAQLKGDSTTAKKLVVQLKFRKNQQEQLLKTEGGYRAAEESAYRKKMVALTAEQRLVQDINKKRAEGNKLGSIGVKIADLFKSKEEKQRQINIARSAVGGGANRPGEKGDVEGGNTGKTKGGTSAAVGAMISKLAAPLIAIKGLARDAIVAPFADAANLLTGESFGMGGGKANASGATSLLGGLSSILKTIPVIGGALGGLVAAFKGLADAILGMDQANFRVARSMNISVEAARQMRKEFQGIAKDSGNLIMNDARLFQSYVEIGSQLGINKKLGKDIYENDVNLRDVLGLEAQSRKLISDQAIITGRNAKELTESAIGTVASFNKLVGTSFKWSTILSEASKLTGVLGLTLTKFPEKIYNAVTATKALGFDLKQLDATASSFLDFEGSISKEMEAQVLTGRDLNLTAAREAALNNDNVTLAKEITKNVGSTSEFLSMNRIQQEGIAAAVGMTRDGLADVLKNQEIYTRAGVTSQKGLVERLDLLQKQKKTQEEMTAALGKDGYAMATQLSNAERLTEMMEKIKNAVVKFVNDSGLLDFLTKPEKINGFITGLTDRLGGFIKFIGNAIATLLEGIGSVVGIFNGDAGSQLKAMAAQARNGSAEFGNSIQSIGANLGGTVAGSVSGTKEAGAQKEAAKSQQAVQQTGISQPLSYSGPSTINVGLSMDGQQFTSQIVNIMPQVRQATSD